MSYKQIIVIRDDLKLPKGKMAGQAAHAAVECVLKSDKEKIRKWRLEGQKKVVVKVKDEKELFSILQKAKDCDFITAMISDAGKTVIAPGTNTCVGIGPDDEDKLDSITGHLKLI